MTVLVTKSFFVCLLFLVQAFPSSVVGLARSTNGVLVCTHFLNCFVWEAACSPFVKGCDFQTMLSTSGLNPWQDWYFCLFCSPPDDLLQPLLLSQLSYFCGCAIKLVWVKKKAEVVSQQGWVFLCWFWCQFKHLGTPGCEITDLQEPLFWSAAGLELLQRW